MRRRRMLGDVAPTASEAKTKAPGVSIVKARLSPKGREEEEMLFNARCEVEPGSPRSTWTPCGSIHIEKLSAWTAMNAQLPDTDYWKVHLIRVDKDFQRRRIGTKLYEKAAREACKAGGHLASTFRLDRAHSHDFWAKQHAKGRAVIHRHPWYPYDPNRTIYYLPTCPVKTLARPPKRRGARSRR